MFVRLLTLKIQNRTRRNIREGVVVRYDETNMTFQHGQHSKPTAKILHCPSEFLKFQLVMTFGYPGVSSRMGDSV